MIHYNLEGESIRINSGSIRNRKSNDYKLMQRHKPDPAYDELIDESSDEDEHGGSFLAFKALRFGLQGEDPEEESISCRDQIEGIVTKIAKALTLTTGKKDAIIVDRPIVR